MLHVPDNSKSARPGSYSRRKFRLSEFLIENFIKGVALLSLAAILLIFIFVFREAMPIFFGGGKAATHAEAEGGPVGASESYGGETGQPESYGEPAAGPETYGEPAAPAESRSAEVGPSETYGEPEGTAGTAPAPAGEVSPEAESAAPIESERDHHEGELELSNLLGTSWQPVSLEPKFGIWPLLVGSLKVTLIALLIGAPIGIFAALYTSTFAGKALKEVMKPVIEILAGFPSVVVGFFALVVLATLMQNIFGYQYRLNALLGGVAMSLAVIPIIYTISEDALAAVPKVLKEASLALGSTSWETSLFVVLPAATPGIFAAVLLGMGRAFGETMIVLMATGNAALLSPSLVEPVRTLSATIGAEMAEVVFGDTHYQVLFLLGAILFLFSFGLNAIAEFFIRNKLMKKFKGA